jgi:hypothetical protein
VPVLVLPLRKGLKDPWREDVVAEKPVLQFFWKLVWQPFAEHALRHTLDPIICDGSVHQPLQVPGQQWALVGQADKHR